MSWKIATTQLRDIQDDVSAALEVITNSMEQADAQDIDILCFPECFLQGYTLDKPETEKRALALDSTAFRDVLTRLAHYKTAAILGMIEEDDGQFFNTAVVIQGGKVLGVYRKVHLFETNFKPGEDYPVFELNGLRFGVNICYDARFSEGPLIMREQGAEVIFYPLNNRLPKEKAIKYRDKHMPNLIDRAKESGCPVVSSDVIYEDIKIMGYGCSAIVRSDGQIVGRIPELASGMAVYES